MNNLLVTLFLVLVTFMTLFLFMRFIQGYGMTFVFGRQVTPQWKNVHEPYMTVFVLPKKANTIQRILLGFISLAGLLGTIYLWLSFFKIT